METNRKSRSNRRRNGMRGWSIGLLCAAVLLAVPLTSRAEDPDFSDIDDILLGRRDLVLVDDIMFAYVGGGNEGIRQYFKTQDGQPLSPPVTIGTAASDDVTSAPLIAVAPIFDINGRETEAAAVQVGGVSEIHVVDVGHSGSVQTLSTVVARWAPGDFNGDGFTDLALRTENPNELMIATAVDLHDVSQGLRFGPALPLPSNGFPVAGDFDGDGVDEIAISLKSSSLGCSGTPDMLQIYSVDPETLEITARGSTCVTPPSGVSDASRFLVAGQFAPVSPSDLEAASNPPDQLALVFGPSNFNDSSNGAFAMFEVDPSTMQPSMAGSSGFTQFGNGRVFVPVAGFIAADGFIDPETNASQRSAALVIVREHSSQSVPTVSTLSWSAFVYTFDAGLNVLTQLGRSSAADLCPPPPGMVQGSQTVAQIQDVALGSFATALEQPSNPDLQLAIGILCGEEIGVQVASFNAEGTQLKAPGPFVYGARAATSGMSVAAGDIQHRSLRLGDPVVARFSVNQPNIILGAPPMHVDFVVPADESEPTELNVSTIVYAGNGFSATFDTAVEGSNQSSQSNTTSFSTGVNVGGEADLQIERRLWQVEGELETAIEAEYESSIEETFNTYTGAGIDVSAETGFRDLLYFQNARLNVYAYPVLGSTSCPADDPSCSANQELPTYVLFSGMDQITNVRATLDTIEWYQPAHEAGNVLSYPATAALLEAGRQATDPDFDLSDALTPTNSIAFTDDTVQTVRYEWNEGMGEDQSVASSSTLSADTSASLSIRAGRKKESGAKSTITGGVDVNSGFETLQTSTQEIGASTGIEVNKPATFLSPGDYQYAYQGIVFGKPFPADTTGQEPPMTADINTTGSLELAFTADPTNPSSGRWWGSFSGYGSAPDVALNHPSRWETMQSSGTAGGTCLPAATGASLSCAEFQEPPDYDNCPNLGCIWTSNFLAMRGFFVTSSGADGGPQRQDAVAGDQLQLQLRVYNYSMAEMPAGTTVHVRFYGQPWDQNSNIPVGDSFLINEGDETFDRIPPFSREALNWQLVRTTFDTTGLDDTYLVFWAVVWMEDATGNLVEEIEDHGLNALPTSLTSIADVAIQGHSNNVGLYRSVFYIYPASEEGVGAGGAALLAASDEGTTTPRVSLEQQVLRVEPEKIELGRRAEVSVSLRAEGDDAEGIFVAFFDGDPADGTVFDVEHIVFIRAGGSHQARVAYRPTECGQHEIFVVARAASNGLTEPMTASTTLEVECDQTTTDIPDDDDGCVIGTGRPRRSGWMVLLGAFLLLAMKHRPRLCLQIPAGSRQAPR